MQKVIDTDQEICFKSQGGWLENAGIIGLVRILDAEDVSIENNSLYVKKKALNYFAEKYFEFFLKIYGGQTRVAKIIDFKVKIEEWQNIDENKVVPEIIYNQLDNWYKNCLKYYIASGSFKKISSLFPPDFDSTLALKDCSKDLQKMKKLKKNNQGFNEVLQQLIPKLQQFIDYFSIPKAKKYFMAKTLSYIVINNAWGGISFLNPQTKTPDLYQDYEDAFVKPVVEYLKADHQKDVYRCATCGRPIKKQKYSYSFLNGVGYDTNRKTSNAWLFNNDQFMCPLCHLMYSAVSAGFNYDNRHQGIFINQNQDIELLKNANNKIILEMKRAVEKEQIISPWRAFALSFQEMFAKSSSYTLADIQVVSYQNGQYRFNLVPKKIASVLKKASEKELLFSNGPKTATLLSVLNSAYIKNFQGQSSLQIYDAMLKLLLVSANLNSLISDVLQLKIVRHQDLHVTVEQIYNLIQINLIYFKEMSNLVLTDEELRKMRGSGKNLGDGYANTNKRQTLAYRLLQALKIQNNDQFMNILLDAYLYQKKLVPKNFIQKLNSPEEFNQLGYAFVAGLIPNDNKNEEEK
ncbi:MAG: type I-B CRISPR-associated protein Cas8b1/Cst1 [Liquorilactobacillus nagelii]|uniref:type I-B CRISPR-associated protein Cas8b1/Cst1 n=1 Tax=Liquorilactobacillus nagelii TaxID=82688 RepID=UPI0039EC0F37